MTSTHPPLLVLQDVLDERLPADARLVVEEHLGACEICRRQLHVLRWAKVRLAGAGAGLMPPRTLQEDVRRVAAESGVSRRAATPGSPARNVPAGGGWRRWLAWWRAWR